MFLVDDLLEEAQFNIVFLLSHLNKCYCLGIVLKDFGIKATSVWIRDILYPHYVPLFGC